MFLSSGVWVDVPSQDTESNTITLRGPQEKLGIALTQVYEKVGFSWETCYCSDESVREGGL